MTAPGTATTASSPALSRRLADLDREAVARIHLAASRWFYDHDLVLEALDHAVKSADRNRLAELLEETCEGLHLQRQVDGRRRLGREARPRHPCPLPENSVVRGLAAHTQSSPRGGTAPHRMRAATHRCNARRGSIAR